MEDKTAQKTDFYTRMIGMFLSQKAREHDLNVYEIAALVDCSPVAIRKKVQGRNLGSFVLLYKTMQVLGTNFTQLFAFLHENYSSSGIDIFYQNAFIEKNRMLIREADSSIKQISKALGRDTSSFSHLCSYQYGHWPNLGLIISICTVFKKTLGSYLSDVCSISWSFYQNNTDRGNPPLAPFFGLHPMPK